MHFQDGIMTDDTELSSSALPTSLESIQEDYYEDIGMRRMYFFRTAFLLFLFFANKASRLFIQISFKCWPYPPHWESRWASGSFFSCGGNFSTKWFGEVANTWNIALAHHNIWDLKRRSCWSALEGLQSCQSINNLCYVPWLWWRRNSKCVLLFWL